MSELRAKEIKRAALTEILDHVTSTSGALTEPVYPALVRMVFLYITMSVGLFVYMYCM